MKILIILLNQYVVQRHLKLVQLAIWIMSSLMSLHAYGQSVQTPASEEQRRRAQDEAQERQRLFQQPNVQLSDETETSKIGTQKLPDESPCFQLHQVTLQVAPQLSDQTRRLGASSLPLDPFFFVQEYLQQHAGICVGKSGLSMITQRVSKLILEKGYSTTRIGLAEQDLTSGHLTFTLVPGLIHDILFSDSNLYGTWRNAFPTGPGQLLNLRDLEQGLEQLKRVSNQDASLQIIPTNTPGESDIVLTVQRTKPWKLSANLDNSGAKSTGRWQAGSNLVFNNLLGLSDLANVGINTDADRSKNDHGTHGHQIYYSIPFGYWNYSIAASDYDYHQTIAGNSQQFISSGKSKNLDVKINYLFQRDQTQKNSWQINVGRRWTHAFIDDVEIEVQRRNVTYAEMAWVHQHYFGRAQFDLTVMNRWGTPWFGAQHDADNRPTDFPTYQYTLQTIDATLNLPFQFFRQLFNYNATLRAQLSPSPLYLSDQFSIGGRNTVRGFDGELTLAAENGFYLRNEFTFPIANSTHAIYAGVDVGKVFGPSAAYLIGNKLVGAALGVRGAIHNLSYDMFAGWPLYRPEQFKTAIPSIGFSFTVQY